MLRSSARAVSSISSNLPTPLVVRSPFFWLVVLVFEKRRTVSW
jgi:hypothetical protein